MLKRPEEFAHFTPSPETIKRCLLTRKSDIRIGTAVKPGLIGCDDFGWDSLFFSICISLEIIGMGAILLNRLPFSYALMGMLVAILLDCLLAMWLHALVSGKSTLLKAEAIEAQAGLGNFSGMSQEDRNAWAMEKERAIRNRRRLALLPAVGIVVFCLAKVVAYAGLKGFRIDTGLLLVLVSYVIVAYIHLTRTGYWVSAVLANFWWNRDLAQYQRDIIDRRGGEGDKSFGLENVQQFEVNGEGIRPEGIPPVMRAGKEVHAIRTLAPFQKNADGTTTPGRYELSCCGVLMDDEVRQLLAPVSMGANEVRLAIALRCMVYQLALVHTAQEGSKA